jgi:hypothetical protein
MMLNHRIIALLDGKPVKVECSTCNSHHNYRAYPPGEAPRAATGTRSSAAARGPRPVRVSASSKLETERRDREVTWEKAIAGKGMSDFTRYDVSGRFDAGMLVHHAKFGDGVVTRVIDANKVEVLFKDDARTLAQGLT